MNKINYILFFIVIFIVFYISGCGYAKHKDPDLYIYNTTKEEEIAIKNDKKDKDIIVLLVVNKEQSMAPLIFQYDILICKKSQFSKNLLGKVCCYNALWNKESTVTHRATSWDENTKGFIMSGDANKYSESNYRMTDKEYIGEIIKIYRIKK
jgi:hypothetical protein